MIPAQTISEYMSSVPEERREAFRRLWEVIEKNLPEGFAPALSYSMPGFVVPHSVYPSGYHCRPEEPLPFISIASQKHYIGLYHLGIYAKPALLEWFKEAYAKRVPSKLDMGKSCIRLKKLDQIPYDLIGELASKITVKEWIEIYETSMKR